VQKVEASAKLVDVVSDDDERANLVDAQFLVFNLVALTWFVGAMIADPTKLPDIPDLLVGLTSVSAIGYTAAKGVASNRPVVTSVTRYMEAGGVSADAIRPGDVVEIRGMNFVPAGAASERLLVKIVVKFGDLHASPRFMLDERKRVLSPSDESILARVPQSVTPGNVRVSVVTAAGIEADPRDMTVVEDKPVITGLRPPASPPDEVIAVLGRHFRVPGASAAALPSVRFGTVVVPADSLDDGALEVRVPEHLAEGAVDVSVRADGGTAWSDVVPLAVLKKRRTAGMRQRRS
jgi:IPT/TIG domain